MSKFPPEDRTWQAGGSAGRRRPQKWRSSRSSSRGLLTPDLKLRFERAVWSLLVVSVAAIIVWLLWRLFWGAVPETDVVSIGIGVDYQDVFPPNTFGRQDAEAFRQLQETNKQQFPTVEVLDLSLSGRDLLNKLTMLEDAERLSQRNLIVFCSLHGTVRIDGEGGPAAYFYPINSGPDASIGNLISVREFLRLLGEISARHAKHVLVLLDVSRLGPNWRLGILNNDLNRQMQDEIQQAYEADNSRLYVLCSASGHESSWTSSALGDGSSVFAHFVLEGLKGKADGWWRHDDGDGLPQSAIPGEGDLRVTCDELCAYVRENVQEWSKKRGIRQTVCIFPQDERFRDFDLVQLQPRNEIGDQANVDASQSESHDESPADASAKESVKPADEGDASADAEPKPKTNDRSAGTTAADTGGTGTDSGKTQTEQAADAVETDSPNAEGTTETSQTDNVRNEQFATLFGDWERRDVLWDQGAAAVYMPREWRMLQGRLLRAEQCLRSHSWQKAQEKLDRIDVLLEKLEKLEGRLSSTETVPFLFQDPRVLQVLASRPVTVAGTPDQEKTISGLLAAALKPDANTAESMKQLAKAVKDEPAQRLLGAWIIRRVQTLHDRQSFADLMRFVELLAPELRRTEAFETVTRVATLAERADRLGLIWSDNLTRLCQRAIQQRIAFEKVAGQAAMFWPETHEQVESVHRALTAAERWLEVGGGNGQANVWYERAENGLKALNHPDNGVIPVLARSVQLYAQLYAELPDFAQWIADANEAAHQQISLSSYGSRMSEETVTRDLKGTGATLSKLISDARLLKTELSRDVPRPTELVALTDGIERNLNHFANTLEGASASAGNLRTIDHVLQVPWIKAEKRRELIELLNELERNETLFQEETRPDENVGGFWQAFWALRILGLSDLDLDSVWKQWRALPFDQTIKEMERRAAYARLGESIRKSWYELASQLNDADTLRDRDRLVRLVCWSDLSVGADATSAYLSMAQEHSRQLFEFLTRRTEDVGSAQDQALLAPASISLEHGERQSARFRLSVHAENEGAGNELRLHFDLPDAGIKKDGQLLSNGSVDVSNNVGSLDFDIELGTNFGTERRMMTVALLESRDDFPVAIRQIRVTPRLRADDWQIEFRTPEELAGQGKAYTIRNRAQPSGGEPHRLLLPLNTTVGPMKACLIRPENDTTQFADIEVYRIREDGSREKLMVKAERVALASAGTPTVIPFGIAAQTADKPVPQKEEQKPNAPIDISRGVIFDITPDGREPFQKTIRPRLWNADKYLSNLRLDFQDLRLSLRFDRAERDDPLLPKNIAVQLQLPRELADPTIGQKLTIPALAESQSDELYAKFDAEGIDRLRSQLFEVFLSVAGRPHALGWKIQYGDRILNADKQQRIGGQPRIRIFIVPNKDSPPTRKEWFVLEQGVPLQFSVQIDCIALDQTGNDAPWSLEYGLTSTNATGQFLPSQHPLLSTVDQRIWLNGVKSGTWRFETTTRDYAEVIKTAGLSGPFKLRVRLRSNAGELVAEDEVDVAVDLKESSPRITTLNVASKQKTFILENRSLPLQVQGQDLQSGIQQVSVGVDLNKNGNLDEQEAVNGPIVNPLKNLEPAFSVSIPLKKLPEQPGEMQILATVVNGLGVKSIPKAIGINFQLPVRLGSFILRLTNIGATRTAQVNVREKVTNRLIDQQNFSGSPNAQYKKQLPEGQYSVIVLGKRKEKAVEVTISKARAVVEEIDVSTLD